MLRTLIAIFIAAIFSLRISTAADPAAFEFKTGERIVFAGDALFERDVAYGYLETMLTAVAHGKNLSFRNIGWSGDTVWGEARAVFGRPEDGYNSLLKMIGETKPDVLFLNYGTNESFEGPAGLARFQAGYEKLLDAILAPGIAPHARVVLLSPLAFRSDDAPAPARNPKTVENLNLYAETIAKIAEKRKLRFIDLFAYSQPLPEKGFTYSQSRKGLTSDGLHPTAAGYRMVAAWVCKGLGLPQAHWDFEKGPRGGYDSTVENPKPGALEKLRLTIAAKNLQFFNKWRPQNETYLFLFRKHEQGRNAKDIPEFDPFIAAKEADIAKLADEAARTLGL